jgi:small subunit ribosomal protein S4
MGQTKRIRKKYQTPTHPWQRDRILEEKDIIREFGLKNKKEVWKYNAKLRSARDQVKKIVANVKSEQAMKERKQLLDKLFKFGIIPKDSKIEDILDLKTKDFLERRLQTIVFRKGLTRSVKQARQFITHGHVTVNGKKITTPSYFVSKDEESKIAFIPTSSLSKNDHPERTVKKKLEKEKKEKVIEPVTEIKEEPKKEESKPEEVAKK